MAKGTYYRYTVKSTFPVTEPTWSVHSGGVGGPRFSQPVVHFAVVELHTYRNRESYERGPEAPTGLPISTFSGVVKCISEMEDSLWDLELAVEDPGFIGYSSTPVGEVYPK